MLRAHASHFTPDRFDVLRRDRMLVGSVLAYVQTLARIDQLAERCEEVERRVGQAIEAMGRVAVETYELEREAREPAPHVATPIDVLELSLPPISGGSPEAYQPTAEDQAEYEAWSASFSAHLDDINGGIELSPSRFTEDDARAAGLAI